MSNINRDYLIVLNPKTSKVTVPELNYYIYDKYTANLFVNLVTTEGGKVVNLPDADQYKLVLHVVKPTNEIQDVENIQVFNKEKALFQIELDQELTKNIGRYKCELLTIDKTDHVVQSAKFSYRVKKSIYNDLDVVTETPEYPIIINLLNKLQDIDKYEEERRANEVARVAAEKARVKDYTDLRQTVTTDIDTMQKKIDSFDGKVQEVDNAVQQMRTNITDYQTEKNKELDNYKTQKDTQINTNIESMKNTIDKYKTEKDKQIDDKITQQDTKIDKAIDLQNKNIQASTKALNDKLDAAVQDQNDTIAANNQAQNKVISDAVAAQNETINTVVESDNIQNTRLTDLENTGKTTETRLSTLEATDVEHTTRLDNIDNINNTQNTDIESIKEVNNTQNERLDAIEAVDVEQNNRLDAIEIKNDQQDSRLNDVEAKNKKQDLDLKCLFAESHSERITIENEVGNSVFLQNSKQGFATIDELKGNTLVSCNKDTDKELILNGNIDTSGYSTVTTTEGVDGGKVDVSLEGNTMVNVCDQEEPVAITKSYTVETGNHIALQGEYDGKCRPNIYGNTLVNLVGNSNLWEVGSNGGINTDYTIISTDTQGIVTNKLTDTVSYFYLRKQIDPNLFKPSTTYTIIFNSLNVIQVGISSANTVEKIIPLKNCKDGYNVIAVTSTDFSSYTGKNAIYLYLTISKNFIGTVKASDVIVLEGDYTNKPIPDYFTGLQSSFEDSYIPKTLVENNTQWTWSPSNKFKQILSVSDTPITSSKITLVINCSSVSDYPLAVIRKVDGTAVQNLIDTKVGLNIATLENTGTTTELKLSRDNHAEGYIIDNVYIIEGDYSNYNFTNYDSTKAGKYKVDYKVTGKNKLSIKEVPFLNSGEISLLSWDSNSISATTSSTNSWQYIRVPLENLQPNTDYILNYDVSVNRYARVYKGDNSIDSRVDNNVVMRKFNSGDCENLYIRFFLTTNDGETGNVTYSNIQIEEGTTATDYEPYKESIKTLYLNSPLLEGDTIEQSGNNIIHNHRYGKVVLDGSNDENWIDNASEGDTINGHSIYTPVNIYSSGECMCDKLPVYNSSKEVENLTDFVVLYNNGIVVVNVKGASTIQEVKSWLQSNPITLISKLKTPTYETISNDSILCDSYTNGHLDVDSVVPIERVVFRNTDIALKYLYSTTEYTIQFESDNVGKVDIYNGSGLLRNINVTKGLNKVTITSDNSGYSGTNWSGIGFNASKIVVTPKVEQTFGYFKGMKSVGECEDNKIEILSQNKNLLDNLIPYPFDIIHDNTLEHNDGALLGVIKVKPNTTYIMSATRDKKAGRIAAKMSNRIILPTELEYPGIFSQSYIYNFLKKNYANGRSFEQIIYDQDYIKFTTFNDCNYLYVNVDGNSNMNKGDKVTINNIQIEEIKDNSTTPTDYIAPKSNKQTMAHEPLRGLPNGVKDKYVIIDGKWYIERNTIQLTMDSQFIQDKKIITYVSQDYPDVIGFSTPNNWFKWNSALICNNLAYDGHRNISAGSLISNQEKVYAYDYIFITLNKNKVSTLNQAGIREYIKNNPIILVGQNTTPIYEPIDYNPLEVYTDTTHISNNSTIPCNMVIRNSGYNCILKPNTTYTVSSNNGLSTVTTKNSIGDSVLRFYAKDTSKITKMSNVLVLEGDYVTGNPPIPAFFKGMESAFEQELVTDENDEHYGKYKVNVKAINADNSQENNITFYINEPLRGVGNVKDKVYVKEDKVVVERNCSSVVFDGSDDEGWDTYSKTLEGSTCIMTRMPKEMKITGRNYSTLLCDKLCYIAGGYMENSTNISTYVTNDHSTNHVYLRIMNTQLNSSDAQGVKKWLQQNPTTVVYQLATPTYEEVEYFDLKLFVEIFKDTTINYNSNIPVTSTINYTYSTPLTDAVNTVSDISDQQDSMIIDMATQVATMEMMLM